MLFAELARTSDDVAATSKRSMKVERLVTTLQELGPSEVVAAIGFLTGAPRQGRTGVGWATRRDARAGADQPSLTILDVDEVLDALAATSGAGSVAVRQRLVNDLFSRATEPEARLVWAAFSGELRQGALAGVMTDAIARAASVPLASVRRAAMLRGDLATAGHDALVGGLAALDAVQLQVMRPVLPMLAATSASVGEALAETGMASVEWKLDGARIQVHRDGDEVRVYTRNLNDVTTRLGLVVEIARSLPARSFILDGEVLGVDDDGRPRVFQDTMSRFGSDEVGVAAHLRPSFFDVLQVDGTDLVDEPLSSRLEQLRRVAGEWVVPGRITAEAEVGDDVLAESLAAGHEGVVVKAIGAAYEAGRRGASWRKVKPVRSLDLVVLAAEWGHGRRTGLLSNLHLGARGSDGAPVMVGKTFKGLTDELLRWQTAELLSRQLSTDGFTVYVRPELVVEIALDGVQRSRRYPGGVALRFARVRGYRPDRSAADADSIETVRELLTEA